VTAIVAAVLIIAGVLVWRLRAWRRERARHHS
jgi:hypothetical protein